MDTLFRYCVFICISLILFNIGISFVNSLTTATGNPLFPVPLTEGKQNIYDENKNKNLIISLTNGLDVLGIITIATTLGIGMGLTILTQSLVPIGVSLYGSVFWGSYLYAIISLYQFMIPTTILLMFTACIIFVFIGSIIGILTGGG